eukprot:TRINITY_DN20797_c0_g1_i3.p1 TRINITY_DN20797_c0_g1~~TRINITY_DN20797_c0_g1_i3.p1  ORF type:complete len:242 (+),score=56.01 TRINITY_DN20797_c0_g1_i3:723-1448(+)
MKEHYPRSVTPQHHAAVIAAAGSPADAEPYFQDAVELCKSEDWADLRAPSLGDVYMAFLQVISRGAMSEQLVHERVVQAEGLLQGMSDNRANPDSRHWGQLLFLHSKHSKGCVAAMEDVWLRMLADDVVPSARSYNLYIRSLAMDAKQSRDFSTAAEEAATAIEAKLEEAIDREAPPAGTIASYVMHAYAVLGQAQRAEQLYNQIRENPEMYPGDTGTLEVYFRAATRVTPDKRAIPRRTR